MRPNARMPFSRLALVALFSVLFVAACGGIEAARDAGERAGGEENARGSAGRPAENGAKPQDTDAAGDAAQKGKPEATTPDPSGEGATLAAGEGTTMAAGEGPGDPVRPLDGKWYVDSDGNVVPDFLETELGYDPEKDDCAPEECAAKAGKAAGFSSTQKNNLLLLLDSSGSMAEGAGGGRTKMEAAKEAVARYVDASSAVFEVGFAVYGHEGDNTEAGRAESCREAAEVLSPVGRVDPETLGGTLARFRPTGWTPIEGALDEAEGALSGKEGEANRVIVVSDGEETCGGDPVEAARRLHEGGIRVRIDVVGFGVAGDRTQQLREVARAGGGEYHDAKSAAGLEEYFEGQLKALEEAMECEYRNFIDDQQCDGDFCYVAEQRLVQEEEAAYAESMEVLGEDQAEHERLWAGYEEFGELRDRMWEAYDEREKARTAAKARYYRLSEKRSELTAEN